MKIAILHPRLDSKQFWGGLILTRQISEGLSRAGHDVHAVELSHERPAATISIGGFRVHRLAAAAMRDGINPLWPWYPNAADIGAVAAVLRSLQPDVVYAHMYAETCSISQAAIELGIPLVHHVHDFAFLCGRSFLVDADHRPCSGPDASLCESCLRRKYPTLIRAGMRVASLPIGNTLIRTVLGRRGERFQIRAGIDRYFSFGRRYRSGVHTWIATGPRIRDVLCRHGVAADRVTILPHALPDDRRVMSPPPPPLAGRPVRIGYFGRIAPEKGVDLLAAALRRLRATAPRDFEWWIITGTISPQDRARLQQRSGLPEGRLRFVEGTQGADLNPVLAQLDVCVVPSLWPEIGPLTLLEALAQGVPCICNDMAGHAHLVENGINGFQFRTGDAADLLRALAKCVANDAALERMRAQSCPIAPFADFVERIEATLAAARDRHPPVAAGPRP